MLPFFKRQISMANLGHLEDPPCDALSQTQGVGNPFHSLHLYIANDVFAAKELEFHPSLAAGSAS